MPEPKDGTDSRAADAKSADAKKDQHTDWFNSLPEDARNEISRLREENKRNRISKDEVEKERDEAAKKAADYDAMLKKQAEEQGKYKELYEKQVPELEAKKELEKRVKILEETFKVQLDEELKAIPEKLQAIIKESGKPIEKMLEMTREIKATIAHEPNSPASERPGGGQPMNMDEWEKIYRDKPKLLELRDSNKNLYDKIIKHFKSK